MSLRKIIGSAIMGGTLISLAAVNPAQAYSIQSINLTADNANWPSYPTGFVNPTPGQFLQYDGFTFTIVGTPGEQVQSLTKEFTFDGLFDDSLALDLNGDGTIDYAADYWDVAAQVANYTPWSDINDVHNTLLRFSVTPTGSSATLLVYGQEISLGVCGTSANCYEPSASVNNLAGINLQSLGFGVSGAIPGSGAVTTFEMRFGYLNTHGGGFGVPNIQPQNFANTSVPESTTVLGLLAFGAMGAVSALKQKLKQK